MKHAHARAHAEDLLLLTLIAGLTLFFCCAGGAL